MNEAEPEQSIGDQPKGGTPDMTTSRNHQETHGLSQTDEQLAKQADAAQAIQGRSKLDRDIERAAEKRTRE